ncbi:hypothetical protein BGW80DRAFT_274556 [Lactifluus volemus]|nr:hypothetical protein BGW80DRAFT_274556 [Lactifluus volemus]
MSSSPPSSDDRGTHSYASSRRVLAHVLARKERDTNQVHQLLKLTFAKLDEESRRATDAEHRATECLVRARAATDARAQADADAAAARSELALYKLQLEQAQREIFRAQEMLDGLESRRHDAEQDAARARTVTRKLQEDRAIETAREQGKEQGWHEGLRQGMLLGRREADKENQAGTRLSDENDPRSRSRRYQEPLEQSSSDDLPPDDDSPSRPITGTRNANRLNPDIAPLAQAPIRSIPYHHGLEPSNNLSNATLRRRHNRSPEEQLVQQQQYDIPRPSRSRQQSRSRSRVGTPALEPARSRPYTPHDDSTPSIIQPIPVPASAASSIPLPLPTSPSPTRVHHTPVQIPPDNWIPRAQDAAGDGRLSIFLPPPHELTELVRVPEGPYAIASTPEDGSPTVVPPPPDHSHSPGYVYVTPPPPDLGPPVRSRTPKSSRSRDHAYAVTPPPPDLGPAIRIRDYANAPLPPPPPPDLGPASHGRPYAPPQRIAKIASNHSRASTHLSEFDILAPVDVPVNNIGPTPAEEEELEYVDAPTVPIPRQSIAPDPPLQRSRGPYSRTQPSRRAPPRPRNVVMPAPLAQAAEQLIGPPPQPQPPVFVAPLRVINDDDAPLQAVSERNRPQRSRTQSSGVIGISVEPPVRVLP